ncbi:MAG: Na/Pi cotransporter family protein [Planctomycetaceae bacterium]|nr:Na/Pi cotransporter family protein [Planctomycetaceae bacterium]
MWHGIALVMGGLGVFLLGMSVMTSGLRAIADTHLRVWLARLTSSPLSGVITGALVTMVVQSSSATTVTAVGFVNAGLLTFTESLGVLFGANIGTTMTGWIVTLVGFKLKLGEVVLPIVLLGMLLRMLSHSRLSASGSALTGFSLIFIGLEMLQEGMMGMRDLVTPDTFPPATLTGHILLCLLGIVITAVTQSSSAGVAMLLTAIHSGNIGLAQALPVVIGMNLGTTVTAFLATLGGKIGGRRTGYAHVAFNVMASFVAFLLLEPYLMLTEEIVPGLAVRNPELVLVGFHTLFNTVGVIVILPFTRQFAEFVIRLTPDHEEHFERHLEPALIPTPALALNAVDTMLTEVGTRVLTELLERTASPEIASRAAHPDLSGVASATDAALSYVQSLDVIPDQEALFQHYSETLLVIDHLRRLITRLGQTARLANIHDDAKLNELCHQMRSGAERLRQAGIVAGEEDLKALRKLNRDIKQENKQYRRTILQQVSRREIQPQLALRRMDAARWLRHIGYHVWKIAEHLRPNTTPAPTPE